MMDPREIEKIQIIGKGVISGIATYAIGKNANYIAIEERFVRIHITSDCVELFPICNVGRLIINYKK